ncbi:MAG: hypothetical protein BHW07_02670 [Clostridium sp. CAG_433_25_7]|nr:MAG: hypothetical protein BHW07_02670 [Clostridium sp. CAG_433_25_7]
MNLDFVNNLFNNLKENKVAIDFMNELSDYLENNGWNNLLADDLTINDTKIISKYKDNMLKERANILQDYAENTKEAGEMYYIYNVSENEKNSYNISKTDKNHKILTLSIDELPKGTQLGSVLRLDANATRIVGKRINEMIEEQIKKQNQFLKDKRIDGHMYEVEEKDNGRIWLYDLNNIEGGGIEEFEEIEFPKDLYQMSKKGDKFLYKDGGYQKVE